MIIIAIILAVSLATINLISKEMRLARVARESLGARSAADTGLECMLMMDKQPTQFKADGSTSPFTNYCGRDNNGNSVEYTMTWSDLGGGNYKYDVEATNYGSIDGPCFDSDIVRDTTVSPEDTKINIFGYNTCDSSKLGQQVQRGIIVDY
jgi:hypothetical protein